MMKKIMLAALGATCFVSSSFANVPATGFYVEANAGGSYNKVEEYYKHDKQEKKDAVKILEASKKFAIFLGGGLGYGYEFTNGFYLGGRIYGSYNFGKIEANAADESNSKKITYKNESQEVVSENIKGSYKIEIKPLFSYGAAIHVGYKVVPNVLIYVGLGGEGTYTKAKQFIEFDDILLKQGDIKVDRWSLVIPTIDPTTKKDVDLPSWDSYSKGGNDELKVTTFAIVPEVGFKFFLSSNMFLGANVAFPIGFKKKMDEKYYNGKIYSNNIPKEDPESKYGPETDAKRSCLKEAEITPYIKNTLNVRYGFTIGYRF